MCAWPPLGAAPGARIAERSLEAMVISWTGGPYWRAAGGFRVCTPQVHLPWVGPLDGRRRTVRIRPLRSAIGRTQFLSHVIFVAWWAPLARCSPLLGVIQTWGLRVLRLACPITDIQLELASPVRRTGAEHKTDFPCCCAIPGASRFRGSMQYTRSKGFAARRGGHAKRHGAPRRNVWVSIAPRRSVNSCTPPRASPTPGCGYSVDAARRRSAGRAEVVADITSPTTSPAMATRQRKSTTWSLESADTPRGAASL